jgi:TolB-like protein/Tfp pilus assembly protein PilF
MDVNQFIGELKLRGVHRAAALYSAGAWAVLQVADVLFPVVGLPDFGITVILLLAAAGFPVAMVVAWFFDFTRHGLIEAPPVKFRARTSVMSVALMLELVIILLLSLLVGYLYFTRLSDIGGTVTAQESSDARYQAPRRPSIAVMPFVNMSEQQEMEYLGDGLAEEILNLLAKLDDLDVAARTSSFYFKGKDADIKTIGQHLGVGHVLEGSVRYQSGRVRVTAQLIEADGGYHLWSETYDRDLSDLLALQDEIASEVVQKLQVLLSPEAHVMLTRNTTVDPEAYDYYLRGRAYLRLPTEEDNLEFALALFDRAIERYPGLADAHAGRCEALLGRYEMTRDTADFRSAEAACQRALTLDRRAPSVYIGLGNLYLVSGQHRQAIEEFNTALAMKGSHIQAHLGLADTYLAQGDLDPAERHYRAAIENQPNHWQAQNKMGSFLFLAGRPEEAIPYYQRIAELMPDSSNAFNNLGSARFMVGEYQAAADAWRRSLALAPTSVTYANVATSLYLLGRYDEAVPLYHRALELAPEDYELWGNLGDVYRYSTGGAEMSGPMYANAIRLAKERLAVNEADAYAMGLLGHYQAALGEEDAARNTLAGALALAPDDVYVNYSKAMALASLGDEAGAMAALERALDAGFPMHVALADANMGTLRGLPRFQELVANSD